MLMVLYAGKPLSVLTKACSKTTVAPTLTSGYSFNNTSSWVTFPLMEQSSSRNQSPSLEVSSERRSPATVETISVRNRSNKGYMLTPLTAIKITENT